MRYGYPVTLDVEGKACAVAGGGPLAEEKAWGLREAGASVTVFAAEPTERLRQWAADGYLRWVGRCWAPADLAGFFLVIAAEADRSGNQALWQEAERGRVLMNALDDPPHCRFTFPSVHRQGALVAAISTTGLCPALAVRLRQQLERQWGPEYASFLALAGRVRQEVASTVPNLEARRDLWYRIVDSNAIALFGSGKPDEAEAVVAGLIRKAAGYPESS
jgi:siroheme synthase-like protein